jgi:hypothetical protein
VCRDQSIQAPLQPLLRESLRPDPAIASLTLLVAEPPQSHLTAILCRRALTLSWVRTSHLARIRSADAKGTGVGNTPSLYWAAHDQPIILATKNINTFIRQGNSPF